MDPGDAAVRVLEAEPGTDLHWTVIWDRALREGLVDPRAQPGARDELVRALAREARGGRIEKTSKGTYRLKGSE